MTRKTLAAALAAALLAPAAAQAAGPPITLPGPAQGAIPAGLPIPTITLPVPVTLPTPGVPPTAANNPGTAIKDSKVPTAAAKAVQEDAPEQDTADVVAPTDSLAAKTKAYGSLCATSSKRKVKGTKGTAFSSCVTAMAKLASGAASTPAAACKGVSKKKVKGQKGTPFSQCVKAAAKLREQLEEEDETTVDEPTTTPVDETAPVTPEA